MRCPNAPHPEGMPASTGTGKQACGEASARFQCAIASCLAVPGVVLRCKASRLRRLPVLAVGAHRWIGSGEPLEGAVHLGTPEIRGDKSVVRDITRSFLDAEGITPINRWLNEATA
jgi:hypothetical protein